MRNTDTIMDMNTKETAPGATQQVQLRHSVATARDSFPLQHMRLRCVSSSWITLVSRRVRGRQHRADTIIVTFHRTRRPICHRVMAISISPSRNAMRAQIQKPEVCLSCINVPPFPVAQQLSLSPPFAAYFARRSTRHSYAMDDYRSSSLYRGDSSYAPSSSAYFNPSVSPAPSSAFDIDGRVVFKRQRLREDSPERTQDIRDWVRGVECRRQPNASTPNSFVEEYGTLSEQPTNESYLRTSPCHGTSLLR